MVVLSLCFSVLSMRAWDRLELDSLIEDFLGAIYASMGQTSDNPKTCMFLKFYLCEHGTDSV